MERCTAEERRMRALVFGLGLVMAAPAMAEVGAADWDKVAAAGFAPDTYGDSFLVMGKTEGCFDDEGFVICSVSGEGLRFQSAYGSVTPEAVLDFLGRVPVGTEVLLLGDVVSERGEIMESVFSQVLKP